jgi:hypothetical protein
MSDPNPIARFLLRREAMKYLKLLQSHWPTIAAIVVALLPFVRPEILDFVKLHPHTTIGVLLSALIAAYNHASPAQQAQLQAIVDKLLAQGQAPVAKIILLLAMLAVFPSLSRAQTTPVPQNIYAGGISFNNAASPAIAGTGLYARLLSQSAGTYAFTAVDVLPNTLKPLTVTSNFSTGVAQKVFTVAGVPIYVPTSAGVSYTGSNTGWNWNTGAMASIKLKKNWRFFPNVRVLKSSVSNGSGVQLTVGVFFGYEK